MEELRILINEDMPTDAELLEYAIRKAGFDFVSIRVDTREGFLNALAEFAPDVIISDYSLPTFTGLQALALAKVHAPFVPFIIVTGALNEVVAVECMKAGADDYVLKDHSVRIGPAIEGALAKRKALLENRRAQLELEKERIRLKAILDSFPSGICIINRDHQIEYANPQFVKEFGELAGKRCYEYVHGKMEPCPFCGNEEVFGGATVRWEWHDKRSGRTYDVCDVPMGNADGHRSKMAIFQDISERKQMEKDLRAEEEKYRRLSDEFNALLDAIPDTLMLQSRDLEIVWANRAALEFIGDNDSAAGERHCYRLLHKTSGPLDGCPVLESFRTGMPAKRIISLPDDRTWEVRAVPVRRTDGRVENVIEVGRDLTEMKKLERQLVHAQKMEAIGQLAGGIAHDFNNIVTALIGYGNLLLMRLPDGDPSRHFAEQMLTSAERAGDLTQGLLAFSRKKVFNLQPLDFNELVRGFQSFLKRIIGDDVEVRIDLAPGEQLVLADSGQMEQVLMNLASNARDAMPDGGTLTITTVRTELDSSFIRVHGYGERGGYLLIEVTDSGHGMDEETQRKIFEPFFTTKEPGKGTGLGLAIVYGIIKEHGGYITVYSRPGMGTTFRIYLRLLEERPHRTEIAKYTRPEGGDETIVIAEDDETVLDMEAKLLENCGYKVIRAADGIQALESFLQAKDEVRLLILDVMMPKKGGLEVAEAARSVRPDIGVLFNSGYPLDLLRKKGLLEGDVHFFTKPIAPRELLTKVREILDGVRGGNDRR